MSDPDIDDPDIEVRVYFARKKNALVARADFSELYAAWYLHRMDCGLTVPRECDQGARDALAALTLHCAGRPHKESCAWTIHIVSPRMNLFAAGDNESGSVVANVFTENIREIPNNVFYSDVIGEGMPARRSTTEFEGSDALSAAEQFYARSEQRPARFFRHGEEDLVMVAAQPDCDLDWLRGLDREAVLRLDEEVELALLETRHYRFVCGCNHERMLDFLTPVFLRQGDELFGCEQAIRIHCPRCGAKHTLTRESLEAHAKRT